jgi:DNA polymerase-3 subunit epsilon
MNADAPSFLALDFETANSYADSACAIGLVRVENGEIVGKVAHLIRPPQQTFLFTSIHGITWDHVRESPTFGDLWPRIRHFFEGVDFLAAHNASFDRRVLNACCDRYAVAQPATPFVCTVQLARKTWSLFPTKLPNVCDFLKIELDHHEALSDAEACARIVVAAQGVAAEAASRKAADAVSTAPVSSSTP